MYKPDPTPHERIVLDVLRNIRLPFEREKEIRGHPIFAPFYVDFYIPPLRLVIEVDGYSHDCDEQHWCDRSRDRYLRKKGRRVARIRNIDLDNSSSPPDLIIDVLMAHGYIKYLLDFQTCEREPPDGAQMVTTGTGIWHDLGMFGHFCEARYKLRNARHYDFIFNTHYPEGSRLCRWCERRRFEQDNYYS